MPSPAHRHTTARYMNRLELGHTMWQHGVQQAEDSSFHGGQCKDATWLPQDETRGTCGAVHHHQQGILLTRTTPHNLPRQSCQESLHALMLGFASKQSLCVSHMQYMHPLPGSATAISRCAKPSWEPTRLRAWVEGSRRTPYMAWYLSAALKFTVRGCSEEVQRGVVV